MLGRINQRRTAKREIFFDLDGYRRGLTRGKIVAPDVPRLLENYRVLADGWKLDVVIREVRELLCFFRRQIDKE